MRDYIARNIVAAYITDENGLPQQVDILDHLGVSLLDGLIPIVPQIISTIADRVYQVGGNPVVVDLDTKFSGATSYAINPTNTAGVTLSGAILTINPQTAVPQLTIGVTGSNSAGPSDPLSFLLTVNAVSPTVTAPLPDLTLAIGAASVVTQLADFFTGASTYAVSPAGQGVTISGGTMTVSAAAERNGTYTITATNSTGQSITNAFAMVVAAVAPARTAQATISPATGPVGTVHTITPATFSGTAPITRAGTLTQAGVAVATRSSGNVFTFTSTGTGALEWSETATNGAGSAAGSASATVTAAATAPTATAPPTITPATGPVGTAFTITEGTYSGTTPITITGILTQAGIDVTAQMTGLSFTSTAQGALEWTETASNGTLPDATGTASATITAAIATLGGYRRIVVIGASLERDLFGLADITTPTEPASTEMGIPVYTLAAGSKRISSGGGGKDQLAQAIAQWPTPGETLFLIGSIQGNDITNVILGGFLPAEADAIAADYSTMLDTLGAHLPHTHSMQTTFRSYTQDGFPGSQLFDNPQAGSALLNDRLTPIFQSRLSQSLYYANGDSMVDIYDLTRNNYAEWIVDGIHWDPTLFPTIRQLVTSRLRAALEGTPPVEIAPAPRPALSVLLANVAAPAGTVGTAYSFTAGRLFNLWDATYAVTGLPAWATLDRDHLGQFTISGTPDAAASISLTVTATVGGVSQTSEISGTISAPVTNTLSIINFTGSTYAASFQLPRNNVFADTAGIVPVALTDILDINGASTGRALNLSFTGSPAIGPTAPGRSSNNNGITAGVPAYAGQLLAAEVTSASLFVTAGVTAVMQITNLTAGAQYEIGFVGSRAVAEVRNTTLTIEGVATTWNTSESAPLERKVTVAAGPDGIIDLIMSPDGATTFAYLGGISIQIVGTATPMTATATDDGFVATA